MKSSTNNEERMDLADFPVVCIGASAGGLDAFKQLVSAIAPDTAMSFFLMQHFDPCYKTTLPEILKPLTSLPVQEMADDIEPKPGHIYVMPPDKIPVIDNGEIRMKQRDARQHPHLPIDHFFSTFAEIFQSYTYGVLLSGMGADGSLGLKRIKELGGVTIVQNPDSAKFPSMPQSAVDANAVDFILEVAEIPAKLTSIQYALKDHPKAALMDTARQAEDETLYKQVLYLLRLRKGVDFSYYKQTTIRRRILRRMIINQVDELSNYVSLLEEHVKEQETLYQDLLIPVTSFFRDPAVFTSLCTKVFPEIFTGKPATQPVRIWVAGCSTGEEAYSIAICLHEYLGEKIAGLKLQLFATDISEKAIQKARTGVYSKRELDGVSEERLEQHFTKLDGKYQVKKNIRDICVFASHNFLKDPPFAKMDLITCRNVLIYMESYLQKKAMATFHYGLNEKGILLLGKSETAGNTPEFFKLLNKQEKLYVKKPGSARGMRQIPERTEKNIHKPEPASQQHQGRKEDYDKNADEIMLAKYVPAAVVVNEHFEIVQFRGATGAFLEGSPGKASLNILKMAREGLSFEIRNALYKARETGTSIVKNGILMQGGEQMVSIEINPLLQTIELHYLVIFKMQPADTGISANNDAGPSSTDSAEQQRIRQLEKDLAQLREDMRTVTEDLEATNEELQSANEELLSGSEELQSLNEELETSKEEVQSTNEELMTINQELYDRNDQYNQARQYAEAIVNTIREPLLVLNRDLRIKSANPSFYETFKLKDDDIQGKILFELQNGRWDIAELRTPLLKIQTNQLTQVEWEVAFNLPGDEAEQIIFLNAQPVYPPNGEQLILLAFKNITLQKNEIARLAAAAAALKEDLTLIEKFFMNAPALFCILKGPNHVFEFINPRYIQVSGGKLLLGKSFGEAFPEPENQGYKKILDDVYKTGVPFFGEEMKATHFPGATQSTDIYIDLSCQAYRNEKDEIAGILFFSYEVTNQVMARREVENNAAILEVMVRERTARLTEANAALEHSNRNLQAFASIASHDLQEPLRKIKTFTGMLRNRYAKDFPPEASTLLNKTETASARMSNLIRDVLNYSRITAPDKNFSLTDLNSILQNVLEDFELLLSEKKAIVNLHNRLPVIEAAPSQMNQLFYNLVSNTLKFSSYEREPVLDISCEILSTLVKTSLNLATQMTYYRIVFQDNGIGFEQQYAGQIFAIFERLNNASKYEGTGIGLALCLKIVQQHHGTIEAEGKENAGSRFTIILPEKQTGINIV